jgi:hypothetical protein
MTKQNPLTDRGMVAWEGEGAGPGDGAEAAGRSVPCLPPLPPGYSAQEAWGFRDQSGNFSYEFCRVYGPPDRDPHGLTCHLDEGRSYWIVLWSAHGSSPDDHPVCRWMTYAQASKLSRARLTFRRFSSPVDMRDEVPRLLGVAGIVLEPARSVTPGWMRAA